ncbi:MBL fold metallo-hydrolase [Bradyrhizobium sp. NC92]|uniref:MBL fold metallo-hydrolase n=1 Tax=Bradyrhizobium sp. (strain NC92) TaxID=55395 RepID=UPI0021AA6FC7|nr:MBL fold metallo-hydrolase [Bradyrhizobium sp. NC92]UWU70590.1 MBL fold metallo-hydrolase [Bradyrhizobium sp. NC92]
MSDFFEIDFLDVEAKDSGDAICLRYQLGGDTCIHVVDGGYQKTGQSVVDHINKYYGNPILIDNVVCTHNDGDHAGGLQSVLESFDVGALWMLRPWMYAQELLPRFPTYNNVDRLRSRLRSAYSNLAALEDIAIKRGIPIYEPFQGALIGAFHVMAPTPARFKDLVVESNKTPEGAEDGLLAKATSFIVDAARQATALVRAAWGDEYFPGSDTSAENEMSVVQYALLNGERIMLTGDTGRAGLREVIDYAPYIGLVLPGIDRFQVPHHGGRHNVTTQLLDELLGPRLPASGQPSTFTAIISSAAADPDHPRKSVVRAMIHRGGKVLTTEGQGKRTHKGAPNRGWSAAIPVAYPEDQEA